MGVGSDHDILLIWMCVAVSAIISDDSSSLSANAHSPPKHPAGKTSSLDDAIPVRQNEVRTGARRVPVESHP
ncbi:hypothetical protein [Nocardia sp. NRRL S-836]|uniref:hypothetical protein n=1 Tax=Nocardia sp. NRRL S-836 TaxID=1519492 RepID=UPI0006AD9347|nr:hypothetical protein [Nocardia sp. NRRL S-836]KOV86324.1 hypothetical protein ADL03_09250 [Nocardia sp. NRRL S-836]